MILRTSGLSYEQVIEVELVILRLVIQATSIWSMKCRGDVFIVPNQRVALSIHPTIVQPESYKPEERLVESPENYAKCKTTQMHLACFIRKFHQESSWIIILLVHLVNPCAATLSCCSEICRFKLRPMATGRIQRAAKCRHSWQLWTHPPPNTHPSRRLEQNRLKQIKTDQISHDRLW